MSQARVLYDLQQIDTEIRAKKQRLGEVLRLQKSRPRSSPRGRKPRLPAKICANGRPATRH